MGNLRSIPLWLVKRGNHALTGLVVALGAVSSIALAAQAADVANVDDARIIENAKTGKEWLSNSLDYSVNRFSPLDQITAANVGKLGLAWSYPLDSIRGVEATPIVVDGIMYVTAPWAIVYAINAKTGEKIWTFDSQSPHNEDYRLCCDVVNRGVAVYKGKVYVGTPDSRLIALDASTGKCSGPLTRAALSIKAMLLRTSWPSTRTRIRGRPSRIPRRRSRRGSAGEG
jgi:glucose dehydrogenase